MALQWTTAADVESRWIGDDPIPADTTKLETLLEDVEDAILGEFPDIVERIADGAMPVARVQRVAARVVIRHLRNPDGLRQAQEQTGPYGTQVMYGGTTPGALALTDEDRAVLAGASASRAFTIDTTPRSTPEPLHPSIDPQLWGGEEA